MSKTKFLIVTNVVVLASFTVVTFQNCARSGGLAANSSISTGQSVTQLGPPTSPPTGQLYSQTSGYQPVLADRYYMDALFTDIFGPSARAANSTGMITDAINQGSPCSLYDNYLAYNSTTGKYVQADPTTTCSPTSENLLASQVNPNASVTRQALLTKACSDLTTNATTLTYALAKISSGIPANSAANLATAFHLFYRIHPSPGAGVIQSLQLMLPATPAQTDWQNVLYTICVSSYWQVI